MSLWTRWTVGKIKINYVYRKEISRGVQKTYLKVVSSTLSQLIGHFCLCLSGKTIIPLSPLWFTTLCVCCTCSTLQTEKSVYRARKMSLDAVINIADVFLDVKTECEEKIKKSISKKFCRRKTLCRLRTFNHRHAHQHEPLCQEKYSSAGTGMCVALKWRMAGKGLFA